MTHRERIKATLAGEPVDRVAVAFWRHWPVADQDPGALAEATLEYQRRYDLDFIKITPSHTFSVDDYGAKHAYRGRAVGDHDHLERAIKRIEDWDRIEPVDVQKGAYGRQLQCVRMVVDRHDPGTPVLQTVFNAVSMARYLAGDEAFVVHLRRDPERVARALGALAETCAGFVRESVAAGVDGIFLSTTGASFEVLSPEEHDRFIRPLDQKVLQATAGSWLNILHLHGQHPMFVQTSDYPIQAVNWHDRTAWPSLAEALNLFPGALVGGVEQYTLLHFGTPADVAAQVQDAIAQTGGRRLIVAFGCTYPLTVPEPNLLATRRAVEG